MAIDCPLPGLRLGTYSTGVAQQNWCLKPRIDLKDPIETTLVVWVNESCLSQKQKMCLFSIHCSCCKACIQSLIASTDITDFFEQLVCLCYFHPHSIPMTSRYPMSHGLRWQCSPQSWILTLQPTFITWSSTLARRAGGVSWQIEVWKMGLRGNIGRISL